MVAIPVSSGSRVAIPVSSGSRVAPQTSPIGVAPSNPTAIGNAVEQLGQIGVAAASNAIAFETQRTQALQTAKALDYSTKIKDLDNSFELAAQQTPSIPKAFQNMSERFGKERQTKIENLLAEEQDPIVKDLAMRYANTAEVDLRDKLNRYQLSKESDYGQHVITEKLDKIGSELLNTSNRSKIGALEGEINATLSAGLKSRYIDYNFIESYQDKVKKISAQREAAAAQSYALNSYLDGTAFADPNNPKDKAMVNGAFTRMINSNDPNLAAKAIGLSAKTGIVPAQLVSTVSGRLTVGTPQQKVQAAQIVSQLMLKNPRLISSFPQTIQAQALSINRSIEAGIPADQAIAFSEKNLDQNKSFDRGRREQNFLMDNTKKLREANISNLKERLSDIPWSTNSAAVPDALIGQYEYLTKEFYMNTGASYEDASAHAEAVIKSQWKMTDIGGEKKLQRYSPESQYGIEGVSNNWIKNQLIDQLSGKPDIENKPSGLIEQGNIDLSKRIPLKNSDGTISTLRSISIEQDGNVVLIPTIQDGKRMTNAEAIRYYQKTGQNLGVFETENAAANYAKRVSKFEDQRFKNGVKNAFLGEGKYIVDTLSRTNYFVDKTPEEINSQIELVIDPESIPAGRPSYFVSRSVNEYGLKEIILDETNQPLRFKPDFSQTEEYKKSQIAREALSVSEEEFAQKLYEKRKTKTELNMGNARDVSLIGERAFK